MVKMGTGSKRRIGLKTPMAHRLSFIFKEGGEIIALHSICQECISVVAHPSVRRVRLGADK